MFHQIDTKMAKTNKAKITTKKKAEKASENDFFKFKNVSEIKKPYIDFSKHYPRDKGAVPIVPAKEKGEPLNHRNIGSPDDDGGANYNQIVP